MKNRYIFTLFLLIVTLSGARAQQDSSAMEPSIVWGRWHKTPKKPRNILGADDKGIYGYAPNMKTFASPPVAPFAFIDYSDSMDVSNSFVLEDQVEEESMKEHFPLSMYNGQDMIRINNKIYMLSYISGRDSQGEGCTRHFARRFDRQQMKWDSQAYQISHKYISTKLTFDREHSFEQLAPPTFRVSTDNSKLLIFIKELHKKRYRVQVLNDDMEEIWRIQPEIEDNSIEFQGYYVTNDGDVYLLIRTQEKTEDGKTISRYKITVYSAQGTEVKDFPIDTNNTPVKGITMTANNKMLICTGFCQPESSTDLSYFYTKIDLQTHTLINKGVQSLSDPEPEQSASSMGTRRTKIREEDKAYMKLSGVFAGKDGNYMMFCRITDKETHFLYQDVLMLGINADGSLGWVNRFPFRQSTYHSWLIFMYKNQVHFIFNDELHNIMTPDYKNIRVFNGSLENSVLALTSIDMDGNISRSILAYNQQKGGTVYLHRSRVNAANDLILYAETPDGKQCRFARLRFK